MTLQRKQAGFTIVELLVVILVIGILAALVITTFSSFQQKSRNSERQHDIKQIQTAIEGYYAQNGRYPTLANINDAAWRTKNLKGLEEDDVKDPKSSKAVLVDNPTKDAYSYQVREADGSTCDNGADGDCAKYTLTATLEGNQTYVKSNLN